METYFDSRIDLLQRNLSKRTDKLKMKAETAFNDLKAKSASPEALTENLDKELQKLKLKVRSVYNPSYICLTIKHLRLCSLIRVWRLWQLHGSLRRL